MTSKRDVERRLSDLEDDGDEDDAPGIIEVLSTEYNKDRNSGRETEEDSP